MTTSLQRPLIFVPADIPYIHCYFHPSSTATSPQRKRPLKLFPAAKNGKLFNDWRTVINKIRLFYCLKVTQRDPYRASLVSISVLLIYFDSYMPNKHFWKQKVATLKYYTPSSTQRPSLYNRGHLALSTRWWSWRGATEYQSKGFLHGSPTDKGIY